MRPVLLSSLGLLLAVLAAFALWPLFKENGIRRRGREEWMHCARLRMVLAGYAADHNGKFPAAWQEFPPTSLAPELRRFHDPRTNRSMDWVYLRGYRCVEDSQSAEARQIILYSPLPVQNAQHVAVFADTSTGLIEEKDLQRQLSKQTPAP